MSGNVAAATGKRVRRTRGLLGDALMELMQEKPFDELTVQDLLDRAGVSRTTFYAHYSDKDDLFLSDVEDFFEMIGTLLERRGADARRVLPVTELLTHVLAVKRLQEALVENGKMAEVRELGLGILARSIARRLAGAGVAMAKTELRALSFAHAGALFGLLEWWLGPGKGTAAKEIDAMFHRMVWRGLEAGSS